MAIKLSTVRGEGGGLVDRGRGRLVNRSGLIGRSRGGGSLVHWGGGGLVRNNWGGLVGDRGSLVGGSGLVSGGGIVSGLSGVRHIGDVATVAISDAVGHSLQSAVREGHAVAALGAVPVPALVLLELGAAVVVRHGVVVAVHGGLVVVRLSIGGGGAVCWADNSAMGGGGERGESKESLEKDSYELRGFLFEEFPFTFMLTV